MLEKGSLRAETGDAVDEPEEALWGTSSLISAVVHEVPVAKSGYVELLHVLTNKVQSPCRESETVTHKLALHEALVDELELKIQLLADEAVEAADFCKQ